MWVETVFVARREAKRLIQIIARRSTHLSRVPEASFSMLDVLSTTDTWNGFRG